VNQYAAACRAKLLARAIGQYYAAGLAADYHDRAYLTKNLKIFAS
jgi:hypothetical protein